MSRFARWAGHDASAFGARACSQLVRRCPVTAIDGGGSIACIRQTEAASLFESVLDSLDSQIAVIDAVGDIIHVNESWIAFGVSNGMPASFDWRGSNYLGVCNVGGEHQDLQISEVADGIRRVISGIGAEFEAEYPCHSPGVRRWFMMRIATMKREGPRCYVISHTDITLRKIAQQELEAMCVTDPLTGLANRRHLNTFLSSEWRRAQPQHLPMSAIMLDIDHFKARNDAMGHAAGHTCLRDIAGIIMQFAKRPTDLAARFGGDEFVIVLANTPRVEAVAIANRIREAVLRLNCGLDVSRQLSISAGVGFVNPVSGTDWGELLEQADRSLYSAKRKGRNRVESAGDPRGGGAVGTVLPASV